MKVFAYILAASRNSESVDCVVPWCVNEKEIFFGPCKKRLRKYLKDNYLKNNEEYDMSKEDIFIMGLNGSNHEKKRKIVWVGKINKLSTFKKSHEAISKDIEDKKEQSIYYKLFNNKSSPLNIEPVINTNNGLHVGYKLRSVEHKKDFAWVGDFTSKKKKIDKSKIEEQTILFSDFDLKNADLDRDICIFLDYIHFAKDDVKGIEIDKSLLEIFQRSQKKSRIDSYNIFGTTETKKGKEISIGLAGGFLTITDNLALQLIEEIKRKV